MTRKRKQRLFLIFLTVCLVFAIVGAASGQTADCNPFNPDGTVKKTNECQCSDQPTRQSFCMTGTEYLAATLGQMVQKAFFSLAENLAGLFWLLARWAALLAEFALQGEVWTLIRETILGLLESIMGGSGGVLDQIVRERTLLGLISQKHADDGAHLRLHIDDKNLFVVAHEQGTPTVGRQNPANLNRQHVVLHAPTLCRICGKTSPGCSGCFLLSFSTGVLFKD